MELRKIYRELEFTSLYKEIRVEDEGAVHREATSLDAIDYKDMGVIASIQGRCPYDIVLDRFALSDGKAVFYSERTDELFSALSRANEVTIHNLKPLFLAAVREGIELHSAFFDTMLAVYLINPARKDYGIDSPS